MAAELGTMRVTEQVERARDLAYDPQSFLVLPRCARRHRHVSHHVALAILTGIVTGWLASLVLLDLNHPGVHQGPEAVLSLQGHVVRAVQSATFGFTITLVGCVVGLATRGGAEGVGLSTTPPRSSTRPYCCSCWTRFWALVLLR